MHDAAFSLPQRRLPASDVVRCRLPSFAAVLRRPNLRAASADGGCLGGCGPAGSRGVAP